MFAKKTNNSATPKKKGPSLFSRINSWLHLWLGLSSGIIIFVVCLSGTIFVFCDDIIDWRAGKAISVQEAKGPQMTPEQLIAAFRKANPDRKPFYFVAYKDRTSSFKIASADKQQQFKFTWVNPYTGEMLATDGAYYFFYTIAHIHSQLLLHEPGNLIVEMATFIFLLELIGGLILWWPKKWNKSGKEQCFKIKWKGKWRRVNYDLHNVLGFYSLLPALMLTVTGLIIVNKTMNKTLHQALGGQSGAYQAMRKFAPAYDANSTVMPLQTILDRQFAQDGVTQVRLTIPPKDSVTTYYAIAGSRIGLKGYDGKMTLMNKYTGEAMAIPVALQKAERIENMNMNLHLGFWYGWTGKIITFMVGLICTSLPITGFLIWWGRRKKTKKPAPVKRTAAIA
ncbi:PepSY-associated TM helix domain-containing protein [Chitinophaga nivalis]|uniref:PepSY domain-containing protein n=1 Tax=Chitinophaga nivalis TaxID=2991709 RepID=A0ABT3IFR7_9BACT|nr:PepSY-associated TM helix domain-containing protein [Chitinophaga nivalis]MCW3467658.1 PepSY domain-containing protein [Chitinophaga nivalis]MCW3482650.1 PepSY domain-containing protein [Chitinophaga nivalis]